MPVTDDPPDQPLTVQKGKQRQIMGNKENIYVLKQGKLIAGRGRSTWKKWFGDESLNCKQVKERASERRLTNMTLS